METIYFVNEQGEKLYIEVSDEVAAAYRQSQREEWRNNACERYHCQSLDRIIEEGHGFEDDQANAGETLEECETQKERATMINKLKATLPYLTKLQRQTIHKLFVLNLSQSEIAREEGVAHQVINKRVARIYSQLKKFLEKN